MANATMTDPHALFLHELGDILYAEKQIEKMLPKLQKEVSDSELADGFAQHLEETRQQIQNIEQVFQSLGEKPKAEKCPGIEGIRQEHDDFVSKEKPSDEVCDLFNTGAASRVEHYEIAAYSGLVTQAKAMGHTDAARLLEENLRQEESMLKRAEKIAERLARSSSAAGMASR